MAAPSLAEKIRSGATIVTGWNIWPEPLLAEIAARSGFDAVTMDMQHGLHDAVSVMRGIGATHLGGKPAIVRVPVGDNGMVSRALDMGAEAVIAPMINTAAEAAAFVAAAKYPPVGERSWGPLRVQTLFGLDTDSHLRIANHATLALAMVETERGLGALDEILAVPGLDGIFVGPSDLSVTITGGERVAPGDPLVDEPIRMIADRTLAAQKIVGAFAWGGGRVHSFKELGYRLIALGTDQAYFTAGIQKMLAERGAEVPVT
jgi:4-hydroxy-2-oxoheptanedioate aldolase